MTIESMVFVDFRQRRRLLLLERDKQNQEEEEEEKKSSSSLSRLNINIVVLGMAEFVLRSNSFIAPFPFMHPTMQILHPIRDWQQCFFLSLS